MLTLRPGHVLTFPYENYRGEVQERVVRFESVQFGSNEWYPEPQWFLHCFDFEKQAQRSFALNQIDPSKIVS